MNSDSETLYLQARGSTTQWEPVPPEAVQHFEYVICFIFTVIESSL